MRKPQQQGRLAAGTVQCRSFGNFLPTKNQDTQGGTMLGQSGALSGDLVPPSSFERWWRS